MALGLLLAAVLAAPPAVRAQETIADAIDLAHEKTLKFDLTGALALYDAILKQLPKELPEIYVKRASLLVMMGDPKGAIADYTKALALDWDDPKKTQWNHAHIYRDRAWSKESSGDLKGAIADYSRAIVLDPKNSYFYSDRAGVKVDLDDYAGALADYSTTIRIANKPGELDYERRGIVRICMRDFPNALGDLEQAAKMDREGDYYKPTVGAQNLLIWLTQVRLDKKVDADKELTAVVAAVKDDRDIYLNRDIARYYLGQAEDSVVFASAEALDKRSDKAGSESFHSVAYYFVGMKQLLDGHKTEALDNFRKSLNSRTKMEYMRELAQVEATALAPKKR
jgi:tetratricopeptide (TPR) repeat protein